MRYALENMLAVNFTDLDSARLREILAVRNNENIRKFMLTSRIISEREHFDFVESLKARKNMAYFGVYGRDSNERDLARDLGDCESLDIDFTRDLGDSYDLDSANFMGVVCLNSIDLANKNATLGIYSIPRERNGAALLKMLRFIAFTRLNLHILYAKVLANNARARRFYIKNGFIACGAMIEAIKCGENFIDLEIFALKNEGDSSVNLSGENRAEMGK